MSAQTMGTQPTRPQAIGTRFAVGFAVVLALAVAASFSFGIVKAASSSSGEISVGPLVVVDSQHDEHADELTLGPGILAIGVLGGGANAAAGALARRRGEPSPPRESGVGT